MLHTIFLLLFFVFLLETPSSSLPLTTENRWILDVKTGSRVKLACVNWPTHMQVMLAEGLQEKPLSFLASQVARQHFNCVRFTYATWMFTRPDYGDRTVSETLDSLNLTYAKAGIAYYNPLFLSMTHVQAFEAVVDEFGFNGVMVVLDNHVGKPTWCCNNNDGNGFFGDTYTDADEWLQGITTVAKLFNGKSQVVAISTHNELHGPNQNVDDWYKYIRRGAEAIHEANPDVLVFVSGLEYANDLTFLKEKPFGTNLDNKLVYEAHWYPWSWENAYKVWVDRPLNEACLQTTQYFINQTAFMNMNENPVPLFVGEVGIDQRGINRAHDHFLSCFLAYATDQDLDWGWWAWQGSYYFRQNQTGMEETFGVLDYHWNRIRNPFVMKRIWLMKRKNLDPNSLSPIFSIIYHPQSGTCLQANGVKEVYADECKEMTRWIHNGQGPIMLKDTNYCLKAVGDGKSPILSTDCISPQAAWEKLSDSKLHLATKDVNGQHLCLHKESYQTSKILTTKCIFVQGDEDCEREAYKDPTNQWFKLVPANV